MCKINNYKVAWLIAFAIVMMGSCKDPYNHDLDLSKLDYAKSDMPSPTTLDEWLLNNYTYPYNIDVKYRWDGSELEVNKTLVPPMVDKVQSLMNVISDTWIEPYVEEAGDAFFKKFAPKQFVLVGSRNYNFNGTFTQGTAEGGRKIVLYSLNMFEDTDRESVLDQMHVIHHEFAHILHQNILYPNEFKTITPSAYTADWTNISKAVAHERGFISPYAMSAPDEDFVEMISFMLIYGHRGFERMICNMPAEGQAKVRQKQQIVINYFTNVYKIDFSSLQNKTEAAIDAHAPKSLIGELGFGGAQNFNVINIDPTLLPPLPAGFMTIYNNTANGLASVDGAGRVLDNIQLRFVGQGLMFLQFTYHTGNGNLVMDNFYFGIEENENHILTFSPIGIGGDENSKIIESGVQPMLDYITGNTFFLDWIPNDSAGCVFDFGGIYPQETPGAFSFGTLEVE